MTQHPKAGYSKALGLIGQDITSIKTIATMLMNDAIKILFPDRRSILPKATGIKTDM